MSSRKARTNRLDRDEDWNEADWQLVRRSGLRPVRLAVGANSDILAEQQEEFGGSMSRWDDDDWEDRGYRRIEPTFSSEGARKKSAPKKAAPRPAAPPRKPAAKKSPARKPSSPRLSAADRPGAPARRGSRSLVGNILYGTVVLCLWGMIAFGALLFWYGLNLPDTSGLYNTRHTPSISIIATDGEVLSHRGDLTGGFTSVAELPPHVPQAVLATEDRRFYWHFGIDPIGLARAVAVNWRAGAYVQGGSTITQQLAKNIFLKPERTISRKIEEMVLAVWLELRFSKDEILTLYLNRVYFGGGAYGLEAASERYFRKPARALTLPEAAMLAGLLKAPSRYSPTNDIDLARERARIVLQNMVEAGYITPGEMQLASTAPANLHGYAARGSINYFVDWIAEALPDYAGRPDTDVHVMATIDPVLQREAERVIGEMLASQGAELDVSQAALVAMTPDGAVRAMVGGRSYAQSQFNRAVQARRQPGSAFKPIVYLTAMERGYTPESVRIDRPVTYGGWSPANYSGRFEGEMTLRTALAKSTNTVAVQLAHEVGIRNVVSTARRLGLQDDLPANLSLALGTGSVNLLELTAAYAAFANGGYGVIPHGIEEVRAENGEELYRRQGSGIGRIADPRSIAYMNDMLKAVMIYGTGRNSTLPDRPVAGKTGTSQDFRDAWFVGYSADLVVGVWVGNDDGKPMKQVTGGTLPAKIWNVFMTRTQAGVPVAQLPDTVPVEVAARDALGPVASDTAPAAPDSYEWEQPGFFERLFGIGGSGSGAERPLLQPGGRR
ncbi:MAG: penicillin-binding protein 1A [Parvibaculum sp.]|nr:penicillin-binding protein 1A [Parvibaculum sp.]